jgi:hypothetical protein
MDYYTFAEIDSEIKTDELTIIITIECPVLTSVARVLHRKLNLNRASKTCITRSKLVPLVPCNTPLILKLSPSIRRYQLFAFGARGGLSPTTESP